MKIRYRTKRTSTRHHIYILLLLMIGFAHLSFWPTAQVAASTSRMAPMAVEQFAQQQANALGASNPDWVAAKLEYFPLGPGTHSWLVHANIQDKRIGYLIISINAQGEFLLSEYGLGDHVLYSNDTLGQALERQNLNIDSLKAVGGKLSLQYAAPLLAYWKVEDANHSALYIDASNGDLLPSGILERLETNSGKQKLGFTEQNKLQEPQFKSSGKAPITSPVHLRPAFDPSLQLNWLTSEPLQPNQVEQEIQHSPASALVFSAGEHNLFYGGPLPVSGYQLWHTEKTSKDHTDPINKPGSGLDSDSVLYVGLGGLNSTQRFVPLNKLMYDGEFYLSRP